MQVHGNRRVVIGMLVGLAATVVPTGSTHQRNEQLPQLHPVEGTVRCDGAPLATGEIVFEGVNDAALAIAPARAQITDGSYKAAAYAGEKTVRIFSPVEVGKPDQTGEQDARETIAPAFNTESTIMVEVAPVEGDAVDTNTFDFDVKSR